MAPSHPVAGIPDQRTIFGDRVSAVSRHLGPLVDD